MAFSLPKNMSIKQEECTNFVCSESFPPSSSEFEGVKQRRGVRKPIKEGANTWTIETSAPFDDGYQWRKYGTKEIRRSNYPRSYFRCTYRDDRHCAATKQVQQKDFTDPPVYEVTYRNSHSCNSTPIDVEEKISFLSDSSMKRPNSISFDFSKCPVDVYSDELISSTDSKPCQKQYLNSNQDVEANFRYHDTINEFTSVGSRTFDSSEIDVSYRESISDYSCLQGLGELDGFGDFELGEYVNSCGMNSG